MLPQATPLHVRLIWLIRFYLLVLKSAMKKWFEGSLSIKYRIYLWLGCFITLTPPPKRLVCYHQFLFSQKLVHASMNGTGCQTKVLDLKKRSPFLCSRKKIPMRQQWMRRGCSPRTSINERASRSARIERHQLAQDAKLKYHTLYLSFFLHGQNFWRIKFTPKNANFSR